MYVEIRSTAGATLASDTFESDTFEIAACRLYNRVYPVHGGWVIGLIIRFPGGGTAHVQMTRRTQRHSRWTGVSLEPTIVAWHD